MPRVDIDDFLETMEVENISRARSDEINFSCPFDGHTTGDNRPSAYMNDGTKDERKATVWKCHGCGRAGNAISFYAEHENVSKQEAALHLRERYAPDFRPPRGGSIAIEFEERLRKRIQVVEPDDAHTVIPESQYSDLFGINWDAVEKEVNNGNALPAWATYILDRGFEAHTLKMWDVGYDPIDDRIAIPVCDEQGRIIGVKGRTWKPKSQEKIKYKILGDKPGRRKRYGFPHYEKSLVLFGLHVLDGAHNSLVLVEGELDVIALWQLGIAAVSSGSASVSEKQAVLLRDYCDEVILFFDDDTAGSNSVMGYEDKDGEWHPGIVDRLEPFIRVKVVGSHDEDAADLMKRGAKQEVLDLLASAEVSHRL